jgi:hypothetical protein
MKQLTDEQKTAHNKRMGELHKLQVSNPAVVTEYVDWLDELDRKLPPVKKKSRYQKELETWL